MDLNYVLVWIVGVSCLVTIVQGMRNPAQRKASAWSMWVLLADGALYLLAPALAGYLALALWLIFGGIPGLASRYLQRLYSRNQYGRALSVLRVLRLFRPGPDWPQTIGLVQALDLVQRGQLAAGLELVRQNFPAESAQGHEAVLQLYHRAADWTGMLNWIRSLPASVPASEPAIAFYYTRALGESGDLDGMVQSFQRFRGVLRADPALLLSGTMILFSFTGQPQAAERAIERMGKGLPYGSAEFWRGTAEITAGREPEGRARLERLLQTDGLVNQLLARQHLALPRAAGRLSPESGQFLSRLEQEFEQSLRQEERSAPGRPYVTYVLLGLNLAMFALELALARGGEDIDALYKLGLFLPAAVASGGEWWRLVASMFLHYGWLHLGMNMLALYRLGPYIEEILGRVRYLVLYLAAGLGAGLIILWLTMAGLLEEGLYAGASGCILGLVGAEAAILLRSWSKNRVGPAANSLVTLGVIIAVQFVFDMVTPQIGMIAHVAGLIIGFAVASIFVFVAPRNRNEEKVRAV